MLKCPSNLQPSPLLRGIFIELSIWPTSCLPISSWMSSPTTARVGEKETKIKIKEITGRLYKKSMRCFYWETIHTFFPDIWLNCACNIICQILIVVPALQKELCNQTSDCLFDTNTPPILWQLTAISFTQTGKLQVDMAGDLWKANN